MIDFKYVSHQNNHINLVIAPAKNWDFPWQVHCCDFTYSIPHFFFWEESVSHSGNDVKSGFEAFPRTLG